jgi:nicotinamidase-related amidase
MLMNHRDSSLLVVDFQARLLPHIFEAERVLAEAVWLVEVARRVGVPIAITEQNRTKLGATDPVIVAAAGDAQWVEKLHFSAAAAGGLAHTEAERRPQVVVCGIESHVCVQQTAMDLRRQGKQVFVVADAVGSRRPTDKQLALARMAAHGIDIVSREMVAFEWLEQAGTDLFREVSRNFLR